MIPYPPVGPLWGSEIQAGADILGGRRLGSTKIAAHRAGPMLHYPSVGPLWGSEILARAETLGGDVWEAPKTQHTGQGQ